MPNVESIIHNPGVVSTLVTTGAGDLSTSVFGLEAWHPLMAYAVGLLHRTTEPTARVIVGTHTIIVSRVGLAFVAVTLPTGHDVAKSIRRMIANSGKTKRPRAPREGSRLSDLAIPDARKAEGGS